MCQYKQVFIIFNKRERKKKCITDDFKLFFFPWLITFIRQQTECLFLDFNDIHASARDMNTDWYKKRTCEMEKMLR